MAGIGTVCKLCDARVDVAVTSYELKHMTKEQACQRILTAFDQHLDDHVEGIIKVLESARG